MMFTLSLSLLLLTLLAFVPGTFAGGPAKYEVAKIPSSLTEKANAVVRSYETTFTIKSAASATKKIKYVITLLNEKAGDEATLVVPYDKTIKVNYIRASLYSAQGQLVKQLKKSNIRDQSAVSNGSVHEDNRIKYATLAQTQYPYTVEFEYEESYSVSLFYPTWSPQGEEYLAVERASFEVVVPAGLDLRYKEVNLPQKVSVSVENGNKKYFWEVSQLTAKESEPFQPKFHELVPMVYTAPADFEYDDYKGSMRDWKSFGLWINQLNANRDQLPQATVEKLRQLTAAEKDDYAKIRKVYEYMQANTRYVSIQLGIGGFQPFEASFVDTKGYGDCKALSNYTKALLKAVGIEAYYTLIKAGRNAPDIQKDFASSQFNHVVLCVPVQQDTVWLECTSQTEAAGYAGSFTGGRHALLITPEGGKIVRTPHYQADDNVQRRRAVVKIDLQGNATAHVATTYTGLQQDVVAAVLEESPEEQKKWLYKQVEIPSFDISAFSFSRAKNRTPSVTEILTLTAPKYMSQSGKRMFLNANFMNHATSVPAKVDNRQLEIVTSWAYFDTDTVQYQLPEAGFQVEFVPEQQKFSSKFGEYSSSVKVEGNTVTYIRTLRMHKGRYPAATYDELIDFYKKMMKADKAQVVLVNKT